MTKRLGLLAVAFSFGLAGSAFAQQNVTVTDATTGNKATVVGNALNVNVTGGGGGTVSIAAATHTQTSALASNLVVKNSPGTLFTFGAAADSTLSAAAWWLLVFDATSAPIDGAVTPALCLPAVAGQTYQGTTLAAGGMAFTVGITLVTSTTGCYTKTASAHAALQGSFQ